ncbi:annexin D4-like isoform X2 [Vitis riparia]|uniref:annexin D4-like isoform X2 n=1 Tax=Vitis riparia TaxID=96939 RepID=UPI00155B07C1|nr:annexin D4-like isoform X2 [Vitis riparia]
MDPPNDFEALTKAFSGKWHSEHLESFRKRTPKFFLEDERLFERWDDHHIACLTKEFLRFKDLDTLMSLKETLQCLCNPQAYFSKVLNNAFKDDADENTKEALTRVIMTRSNVDMKEIIEEFDKQYKVPLTQKIEDVALGNYKDFLVSLIRRVA